MAPHPLAGMPQTDRQNARVILSQIQASVPTADCLSSGVQSAPWPPPCRRPPGTSAQRRPQGPRAEPQVSQGTRMGGGLLPGQ